MKNTNMLERIWSIFLIIFFAKNIILQASGMLSVKQSIFTMITASIVIVLIILEKVLKYVRPQRIISDLWNIFYVIEELHKKRYKALLNGKKEEGQKLDAEFKEESEALIFRCKEYLEEYETFDEDQIREIKEIISCTERLQQNIFVR